MPITSNNHDNNNNHNITPHIFCTAILGKMSEPIVSKNWAKFTMNVQSVYKRGQGSRLRRGPTTFWIHDNDLKCKCPKIKPGR